MRKKERINKKRDKILIKAYSRDNVLWRRFIRLLRKFKLIGPETCSILIGKYRVGKWEKIFIRRPKNNSVGR